MQGRGNGKGRSGPGEDVVPVLTRDEEVRLNDCFREFLDEEGHTVRLLDDLCADLLRQCLTLRDL